MLKWYHSEMGVKNITIAAPSSFDLVQTMVKGNSGVLECYGPHEKAPKYSPHYNTLEWDDGATARLISSESSERSRGANSELLLADELGSFVGDPVDFWHNLEYGLRLGVSQAIIATTPRATPLMIELVERAKDPNSNVRIIQGTTLENDNLSPQMLENARRTMNTRLGRREVMGELQLSNEKACWQPELLDKCRATATGEFHPSKWRRAIIGVDPAGGSTSKDSDKTGIVAGILTESGKVLIIKDLTDRMTGEQAVSTIAKLYYELKNVCPVKVRVESNGVGQYFKSMIVRDHPFIPVESFPSTTKKYSRAVAAAHLYETGVVFHDKDADLNDLESEQVSWEGFKKSPDHVDALGFCIEGLTGNKNFTTRKQFIL